MAGCLICVFGSLGEYVLVKVLYSATEDAKFHYFEKAKFQEEAAMTAEANGEVVLNEGDLQTSHTCRRHKLSRTSYTDSKQPQRSFSFADPTYLDCSVIGNLRIPLQWDGSNGKSILLWRKIDDISKWVFPFTFCIFCAFYWIILYIHYVSTNVQPYSRKFNLYRSTCIE